MTSPDPGSIGLSVLAMAQAGQFAEIRERFAPPLRPLVSSEGLRAAWSAEVAQHGPLTAVGEPVSEPVAGAMLTKIPVTFERAAQTVIISMDETGWLIGIQFAPAAAAEPTASWAPPDYVDQDAFDEQDVTVGSGPLAVGGTLSLPRGAGPHPAVVLLAGSGPNDRDETLGRNKPFRDLAGGLAGRGVAVLRFDKVTHAHRDLVSEMAEFTLSDEYVHDAVAAIHLLAQHPDIDAERVFVLGHSLGGTVAPRVALAEPSVAGLVVLGGGAQPLHWAAVRQFRYLAALNPQTESAAAATIEAITRQARTVDSPDLSRATPASDLPFGVPAAYWLDLRSYHPAEVAATVQRPMFILQGGRDYQVTVADDLALWQAALADRSDVTIRVYQADNHLFFPGSGPSTPAEYEPAQHVDPAVVTDIAAWLASAVR